MKKIAVLITSLALAFAFAAPANAGPKERKLVKTMVMIVFYEQSYDDQETLCWGWENLPNMALNVLTPAFSGQGYSRKDIRAGIRAGFNTVC